jgi:hypothetical protein
MCGGEERTCLEGEDHAQLRDDQTVELREVEVVHGAHLKAPDLRQALERDVAEEADGEELGT